MFNNKTYLSVLASLLLLALPFAGSASAQINNGLIGNWTFDETSGLTAANSQGNSSNATLSNFPANNSQWVPGVIGNALHFRGPSTQDYAIVANYPKPTSSISFSGWVNADTNAVTWQSIVKNWGNSSIGQFHLGLDGTSKTLSLYLTQANGSTVSVLDNAQLPVNRWVQVGFVADAGSNTVSLYRDGAVVGTTSYNGTLLNTPISSIGFGVKTDNTGANPDSSLPGFWQGSFDDFAFWNRAVTSTEMAQIRTNGLAGRGIGAAVVPEANTAALLGLALPMIGLVTVCNRVASGARMRHGNRIAVFQRRKK